MLAEVHRFRPIDGEGENIRRAILAAMFAIEPPHQAIPRENDADAGVGASALAIEDGSDECTERPSIHEISAPPQLNRNRSHAAFYPRAEPVRP